MSGPAAPVALPVATLRMVAPLLAALALVAGAFATVSRAGCDDPARYAPLDAGEYELVGGCLAPGDYLVPDPGPTPVDDADDPGARS